MSSLELINILYNKLYKDQLMFLTMPQTELIYVKLLYDYAPEDVKKKFKGELDSITIFQITNCGEPKK